MTNPQTKKPGATFQRPDVVIATCRSRGQPLDPADNLPAPGSGQSVERSLGGAAEDDLRRRAMCL
jgi:hypothetical protein